MPGLRFAIRLPDQADLVEDRTAVGARAAAIHRLRDGQVAQEIAQLVENAALQGDVVTLDLPGRFQPIGAILNQQIPYPGVRSLSCLTANNKSPQLSSFSFSATNQVSRACSPVVGQQSRANNLTYRCPSFTGRTRPRP